MASQGPLYPGTVTTEIGPSGDNDWTTPGNIAADDGSEAQITAATYDANDHSYRLKAQNFGFSIPAEATINGILVEIEQRRFAGAAEDQEVRLYDDTGTLVGDDKQTATAWPGTATIASYGGSTDAWNAGLTPAKINDPDFGVAHIVLATAANTDIGVDFIRVTVYYTVPASINAEPAAYALTGAEAGTLAARLLVGDVAAYALAGFDAGLSHGFFLAADPASYALTGSDAGLLATRLLNAAAASYTLSGADAGLLAARLLNASPATYTLTGFDATLQGPAGAFVLMADPASYALTGAEVGLLAARQIAADPGAYVLTGAEAAVLANRMLDAGAGVYVLTGLDATLVRGTTGYALNAEPGVYAIVGADAALVLFVPEKIAPGAVTAGDGSTKVTADSAGTKVTH